MIKLLEEETLREYGNSTVLISGQKNGRDIDKLRQTERAMRDEHEEENLEGDQIETLEFLHQNKDEEIANEKLASIDPEPPKWTSKTEKPVFGQAAQLQN